MRCSNRCTLRIYSRSQQVRTVPNPLFGILDTNSPCASKVSLEVGVLLQAWVAVCWQHLAMGVDVNTLHEAHGNGSYSVSQLMPTPCLDCFFVPGNTPSFLATLNSSAAFEG